MITPNEMTMLKASITRELENSLLRAYQAGYSAALADIEADAIKSDGLVLTWWRRRCVRPVNVGRAGVRYDDWGDRIG